MKTRSIALASLLALPITAHAVDCSLKETYRTITNGSYLCIDSGNYPRPGEIKDAAEGWNSGCWTGDTMPSLVTGGCGSGDVPVRIIYKPILSTNRSRSCGDYQANASSTGANAGGTITLYESYIGWDGLTYLCSTISIGTILHELGHALGLRDVNDPPCDGHVMGTPIGTQIPAIRTDDCQAVNSLWTTQREQENYCNSHCWTSCDGTTCPPSPVSTPAGGGTSPIIIDLDDNGFDLSSLADGVTFDIDADGAPNRISWTKGATGDAFLVLDRNGNGIIDDGRELFGNATRLQSGEVAPNGYEALAEYDDAAVGGSGDSVLSANDAIWEFLAVWTDRNHDGVAQPPEIESVTSARIVSIDTKYTRSNHQDQHGNIFRFKAKALVKDKHGRPHPETTYDVFFVEQ